MKTITTFMLALGLLAVPAFAGFQMNSAGASAGFFGAEQFSANSGLELNDLGLSVPVSPAEMVSAYAVTGLSNANVLSAGSWASTTVNPVVLSSFAASTDQPAGSDFAIAGGRMVGDGFSGITEAGNSGQLNDNTSQVNASIPKTLDNSTRVVVVPAPGAVALAMIGLGAAAWVRRRTA